MSSHFFYDEVYSIGCFDFFHEGHQTILKFMKYRGKKVIVGVHDDKSIEELKNIKKHQHQPIEKRIENVKTIADIVFVVTDKDPTLYIKMIHNLGLGVSQVFIRADDNKEFPGKKYVEKHMDIEYVPYTKGVSSTEIRKKKKI